MPSSARDCEQISIVGNISKKLQRRMMLKKQVHLNANATDILEHVAELHVFGVGAKSVKTMFR